MSVHPEKINDSTNKLPQLCELAWLDKTTIAIHGVITDETIIFQIIAGVGRQRLFAGGL